MYVRHARKPFQRDAHGPRFDALRHAGDGEVDAIPQQAPCPPDDDEADGDGNRGIEPQRAGREELKARRLNRTTLVRRATSSYFRCTNPTCLLAQLWPDSLPDLPRYDDGHDRFVCPSCRQPLEEGQQRSPATQLIVFLDGAEQFRVLLDDGDRLMVGRREAKGCLGLQTRLPEGTVDAISRVHLAFMLRGGQLTVEDLGSRNGTVYRLPGQPDEPMTPGKIRSLGRRGTIALPGGVTIELSGRSVPLDGERVDETVEPEEDIRATRLLAGP